MTLSSGRAVAAARAAAARRRWVARADAERATGPRCIEESAGADCRRTGAELTADRALPTAGGGSCVGAPVEACTSRRISRGSCTWHCATSLVHATSSCAPRRMRMCAARVASAAPAATLAAITAAVLRITGSGGGDGGGDDALPMFGGDGAPLLTTSKQERGGAGWRCSSACSRHGATNLKRPRKSHMAHRETSWSGSCSAAGGDGGGVGVYLTPAGSSRRKPPAGSASHISEKARADTSSAMSTAVIDAGGGC